MSLPRRAAALVPHLGLLILVTAALAVSAIRLALPHADDYRDRVAQILGRHLGYPVALERLSLRLASGTPRLSMDAVTLSDTATGRAVLHLRTLALDLDVLASLRAGAPRVSAVTLIGGRLMFSRSADGGLHLVGLEALGTGDPAAREHFLSQGRLALIDTEISLVDPDQHETWPRLADVQLQLVNRGQAHRLGLSARLLEARATRTADRPVAAPTPSVAKSPDRVELVAVLTGPPADPRTWAGHLYADLSGADLGDWLPRHLIGSSHLRTERVRIENWTRIHAGHLAESLLRMELAGLDFTPDRSDAASGSSDSQDEPLSLGSLRGVARVQPSGSEWRIQLGDLHGEVAGARLSGIRVDARMRPGQGPVRLAASAARLDLAAFPPLLNRMHWSMPPALSHLLAARPRGEVQDLALYFERGSGQDPTWRTSATLSEVGFDRTASLPGATGLTLALRADQTGGAVRLASEHLTLDPRPLFSESLRLDQCAGRLDWRHAPGGGLRLAGHHLRLANADLAGRARFVLEVPADGTSPLLDLRARFQDGNAARVRTYLPVGIMHPDLVDWLTRAIVAGRIPTTDLQLRGRLADYPFRQREGRFELVLGFEETWLDYLDGWPPLTSAAGHLRFLNEGLDIQVERGRVYDSLLTGGEAHIQDLRHSDQMMIRAAATGPSTDGLRTLTETPLAADLGPLAKALEVSGNSRLRLTIDLPLVDHRTLKASGEVSWPTTATVGLKGTPILLSRLNGSLTFDTRNLSADRIDARLWGQPLRLSIATLDGGHPASAVTRIQARSQTGVAELAKRVPSHLWNDIEGDLDWDLAVTLNNREIRQKNPTLSYQLNAQLRNLAVALPAPLGKSAGTPRMLDLKGILVPQRTLDIEGRLGEVAARLALDLERGVRLQRGRLRFGAASAPAPDREGLFLDGHLTELDLPRWLAWSDTLAGRLDGVATRHPMTPGLAGAQLQIERLRLGGPQCTGATLGLTPQATGWMLRLKANELAGRVSLNTASPPSSLELALEDLDLRTFLSGSDDSKRLTLSELTPAGLQRIPPVALRVTNLRWGDTMLGTLDLALRTSPKGIQVPQLNLSGDGLLTGQGTADWIGFGADSRSHLALELEVRDPDALSRLLDDQSLLEADHIKARLDLNWSGGFGDVTLTRTTGTSTFEIGSGRLLAVEPGVGRVFGFLNLAALGRRLALDFSDLYGQGFAFERMDGGFRLGGGEAKITAFTIAGPAGTVSVEGTADLRTQTLAQTVTVEPRIGSSVALASAVAGGPVVGAAVYLVDRVTGNAIDRLGRYRYRVTGPWTAPELRRIGWEPWEGKGTGAQRREDIPTPSQLPNPFLE